MADNVTFQAPLPATPAPGTTIATDDVGGVQIQYVKLDIGGDGVSSKVTSANPLPISAASLPLPTDTLTVCGFCSGIITPQQAAQILADAGDIPSEFVPEDVTPTETVSDEEKPAAETDETVAPVEPQPEQIPTEPVTTKQRNEFYAALYEYKQLRDGEPGKDKNELAKILIDLTREAIAAKNAQPAPVINMPAMKQSPITVNVPEQPAPVVNVSMPEQKPHTVNVSVDTSKLAEAITKKQTNVTVNVPPQPAPNVTVNVPEQPTPQVTVNMPERKPQKIVVERAYNGLISELHPEPEDKPNSGSGGYAPRVPLPDFDEQRRLRQ